MDALRPVSNIMLHFTPLVYLSCALLLFMRRKDGDTSRSMLAFSVLIWGILMLGNLVYHYNDLEGAKIDVLSIISLQITLIAFFAMVLYPAEVIASGRITIKNILILCASNVVILMIILLTQPEFRKLYSFSEIIQYIGEYNVWFRLVIALYFLPLSFIIFFVPYKHTKSRVNIRWIRLYCVGMLISTLIYIVWILTGSTNMRLVMQTYCLVYCLIITYQELYLRLPSTSQHESPVQKTGTDLPERNERINNPKDETAPLHKPLLWNKLQLLLREQQPWRNPDLTLNELASLLETNRTTLSKLIKESGYEGFNSLINTCRIREFIHIIEHQEIDSLYETFFNVGFRSKATALRYFRQETGTTPSDYLQKRLPKKKEKADTAN